MSNTRVSLPIIAQGPNTPPHSRSASYPPQPDFVLSPLPSARLPLHQPFIARFDDFFPVSPASRMTTVVPTPPPYTRARAEMPAPAYGEEQEAPTLAKFFFRYGFVFPAFWLIGATILFMPLLPCPEAECGKTAEEQAEEMEILRRTELYWAKKCAVAFLTLLALVAAVIVGVVVWKVMH